MQMEQCKFSTFADNPLCIHHANELVAADY